MSNYSREIHLKLKGLGILVLTGLMGGWPLAQQNGADQPEDQPRFRVEAFSSLHEVRVLDREGNVVRGLRQEDFQVLEEGRQRPLSFFVERSDYAVTLALLVDTGSNMSEEAVGVAKTLILDLIHRLDRDDQILLAAYSDEVYDLTPITSDRLQLLDGLRNLSATGRKSGLARLGRLFASDAWTGPAIDEVLIKLKKASAEEKIILVFSAGFGNIGLATLDHLQLAGARLIAVSVENRLGNLFNLGGDQAAVRRVLRGAGGINYRADEILERVNQLRDVIKHHYLMAYEPADPEKLAESDVQIRVLNHPEYNVHFARRTRSTSAFY